MFAFCTRVQWKRWQPRGESAPRLLGGWFIGLCVLGRPPVLGVPLLPLPHKFPGVLLLALRPAVSPRAGCRAGDTALPLSPCGLGGRVPAGCPHLMSHRGLRVGPGGRHGATPLVQDQTSVFETRLTSFGYFYLLPHSPGLV